MLGPAIYLTIAYLFGISIPTFGIPNIIITVITVAMFLALYPYLIWQDVRRHSSIKILNRSDESNFFSRKKDDLLLLVVGAALGSFFTWIIGNL
ncbi:hypothetical protein OB13_02590 [Pontibacter sp. HJ8]